MPTVQTQIEVVLVEKISKRPNGDRDTDTHDSSLFEVVLRKGGREDLVVAKFDMFDPQWTSIRERGPIRKEAADLAGELCGFLGARAFTGETYRWQQPEPQPYAWVKVQR